jgi:hypothetical protein
MNDVKEKKCPRCEMDNMFAGIAIANVACGTIKDEEKQGACMEWANGIDPTKMSAEQILEETYDRAGINGIAAFPEIHNAMVRKLIIKKVGQKLEKGIAVTKEEQELYNRYTKKEEARGL